MTRKIDLQVDARGLKCPLPVLRAGKVLRGQSTGTVIEVLADDPMAQVDMPHFCAEAGHLLLSMDDQGDHHRFLIERGTK
ncbi:MAG: sulfurtransferase TusA family protein [Pseudomonadota bacterium]